MTACKDTSYFPLIVGLFFLFFLKEEANKIATLEAIKIRGIEGVDGIRVKNIMARPRNISLKKIYIGIQRLT